MGTLRDTIAIHGQVFDIAYEGHFLGLEKGRHANAGQAHIQYQVVFNRHLIHIGNHLVAQKGFVCCIPKEHDAAVVSSRAPVSVLRRDMAQGNAVAIATYSV